MTSPLAHLQGEFVETVKSERGLYGLTMAAIEQVAQQGLACVTHMSLEVSTQNNMLSVKCIDVFLMTGCPLAQEHVL